MTVSVLPIFIVDFAGSVFMILLSVLCLNHLLNLKRQDPGNLIWMYLFLVCTALTTFAISRSAGHILKQFLFVSNHGDVWSHIAPYSGTINTFMLTLVAAFTLFFERVWKIHDSTLRDKRAVQDAHRKLVYVNQNLEKIVTERTEALAQSEKQMAQADRLASIGQLSAGIAHEINNPLGIILGYTQLLLRNEGKGSQQHDDLKTIEKHVRHCKTIVEDLLDFARSSPTQQAEISIHDTLDEVLDFIQHHGNLKGIDIERNYDTRMPLLMLDEKKIKQVLINLMMNAHHAVGPSGTIQLETRFDAVHHQIAVRIKDTGHGIEKKNLSRIFDPFFTTKPTGEGTGLGLSVSYGIIKDHDGDIIVESEPGRGTTFTILLPAPVQSKGSDKLFSPRVTAEKGS